MTGATDIKAMLDAWQAKWSHQALERILTFFAEGLVTSVSGNRSTRALDTNTGNRD